MDQRGFPRVVDGLFVLNNGDGADIGAVEAEKLLTDIVIDGSDVRVRFPTFLGNTYAVEFSTVLAAGNWTALPNLVGTGSYASVTHVNGATLPQVFYRLSCPP